MQHDIMTPEGYAAIAREMGCDPASNNVISVNGQQMACGWSPPDRAKFHSVPVSPHKVRDRASWTDHSLANHTPAIYDQNPQSSCVGHGAATGFGTAWSLAGFKPQRFSPCFVYGLINGGRDNGANVIDSLTVLRDYGICLESTVGPREIWQQRWPANAKVEAKRFKGIAFKRVENYDGIVDAILGNKPVVLGVFIGNNFNPAADGRLPRWDRRRTGGHCMAVCEVKLFPGESEHRIGLPNSWGTWFGKAGWCYAGRSYVDEQLDFFEAYAIEVVENDANNPNTLPEPTQEA